MKLLQGTHLLLWAAAQPSRRPAPDTRESIGWSGLVICADYRTNDK